MRNLGFAENLNKLNSSQRQAVETIDGPVLVVAGPGTGKTQLLAMRVANILDQTDTLPQSILCLTFTDSAAQNMRQRLRLLIGPEAQKVAVHTFHSLGTEVINQNPEYFFFGAGYEPADDLDKITIIEEILSTLEHSDPLRISHREAGWTYRDEILGRIADLKQAGLTPGQFSQILDQNHQIMDLIDPLFSKLNDVARVNQIKPETLRDFIDTSKEICQSECRKESDNSIDHAQRFVGQLSGAVNDGADCIRNSFNPNFPSWSKVFLDSLEELSSLLEFKLSSGAKWPSSSLKLWRDEWGKKADDGQWHLKDWLNQDKFFSLAKIYTEYQNKLHTKRLFDFDDMLLEVVQAFQKYPSLRFSYQEKYLYIMVDEFQDTNGVQMSLIDNLVDLEISEGRPNLLAVGDDDQAIYKFQRATVQNILNFKAKYRDVKIITLTDNYRSSQDILDLAQIVIEQSQVRLADLPEVSKVLVSRVADRRPK
jgi:DNA helicase-2/ATP-dependent DNA helicase PcrA